MHARRLTLNPENWYYLPMEQYLALYGSPATGLFVRVNGRAEDFVTVVRRRLQAEMPGASYVNTLPLSALVAPTQRSWEFGATMFVAFGGLALILAAIGLYSTIAYAVAQRTREFGVRMALGASSRNVMGMILRQGMALTAAGILIGSAVAFLAGRWLEPLLFAQKARDPLVFVSVALLLLFVALAATLQPAWRATRVDPTRALRTD
jgi:ABC-type antimicrobial peptide transport system permease subunit